jgi:cobalt/nickel transport system permease protein
MHIPDGLLPVDQSICLLAISFVILAVFFYRSSKKVNMSERLVLTGVLTAITVVATSLTIPSPIGIPMHFFIIPLVVLILGPCSAALVAFIALLVEALVLGNGGVLSLGANILNMGIVLSVVVYFVYRLFESINKRVAIFISTILGILAATTAQILILTIANVTSLNVLLASLLPYYLMIGVMEGIINVIVIEFISKMNYSILDVEKV